MHLIQKWMNKGLYDEDLDHLYSWSSSLKQTIQNAEYYLNQYRVIDWKKPSKDFLIELKLTYSAFAWRAKSRYPETNSLDIGIRHYATTDGSFNQVYPLKRFSTNSSIEKRNVWKKTGKSLTTFFKLLKINVTRKIIPKE